MKILKNDYNKIVVENMTKDKGKYHIKISISGKDKTVECDFCADNILDKDSYTYINNLGCSFMELIEPLETNFFNIDDFIHEALTVSIRYFIEHELSDTFPMLKNPNVSQEISTNDILTEENIEKIRKDVNRALKDSDITFWKFPFTNKEIKIYYDYNGDLCITNKLLGVVKFNLRDLAGEKHIAEVYAELFNNKVLGL